MGDGVTGLAVALTAFVGSHFLLSHPLRAPIVRVTGAKGFLGLYSLIAFATLFWVAEAFKAAPSGAYWRPVGDALWAVATVIMLAASILLVGSLRANPAMPDPTGRPLVAPVPRGVFTITRHPMMWSITLWAGAHVLVSPRPAVLLLSAGMAILALGGAWGQDRKKARIAGAGWQEWVGRTSFLPFARGGRPDAFALFGGVVLWLVASFAHPAFGGPLAGIWRWVLG